MVQKYIPPLHLPWPRNRLAGVLKNAPRPSEDTSDHPHKQSQQPVRYGEPKWIGPHGCGTSFLLCDLTRFGGKYEILCYVLARDMPAQRP